MLLAFEQVGGADRALEMAKDYAMERYAFGRPIGSYQAIKHKLADMYVKNELARSNAYYGAWALETGAAELPLAAAAAARVAACEAYWFAAKENLQTHGGIGFTWEMDCHLFYRRAQQLGLVAGGAKAWKERLVSQLERRNARLTDARERMDFNDTPEEAAYRAEARAWLEANAPQARRARDDEDPHGLKAAKAWQAKKAAAGYACITWPKEWGGVGGSQLAGADLRPGGGQVRRRRGNPFQIGLGMCVPTIMTAGNEVDKQRFVGPALRGEEIWCQLFSEPSGGSDVARRAHPGGARRRRLGRLDHQRPEGLDLRRPVLRLRHR